jgi:hypothetical protein
LACAWVVKVEAVTEAASIAAAMRGAFMELIPSLEKIANSKASANSADWGDNPATARKVPA